MWNVPDEVNLPSKWRAIAARSVEASQLKLLQQGWKLRVGEGVYVYVYVCDEMRSL